jgi:hypothetical protein
MVCLATGILAPMASGPLISDVRRQRQPADGPPITLKDIRAKAARDAKKRGYGEAQIQVALAQADLKSTRSYVRRRELPVS